MERENITPKIIFELALKEANIQQIIDAQREIRQEIARCIARNKGRNPSKQSWKSVKKFGRFLEQLSEKRPELNATLDLLRTFEALS